MLICYFLMKSLQNLPNVLLLFSVIIKPAVISFQKLLLIRLNPGNKSIVLSEASFVDCRSPVAPSAVVLIVTLFGKCCRDELCTHRGPTLSIILKLGLLYPFSGGSFALSVIVFMHVLPRYCNISFLTSQFCLLCRFFLIHSPRFYPHWSMTERDHLWEYKRFSGLEVFV